MNIKIEHEQIAIELPFIRCYDVQVTNPRVFAHEMVELWCWVAGDTVRKELRVFISELAWAEAASCNARGLTITRYILRRGVEQILIGVSIDPTYFSQPVVDYDHEMAELKRKWAKFLPSSGPRDTGQESDGVLGATIRMATKRPNPFLVGSRPASVDPLTLVAGRIRVTRTD